MKILVLNCGSSSLKYQLIDMDTENVMAKGLCERIGIEGSRLKHQPAGKEDVIFEEYMEDHSVAVKMVLDALTDKEYGVVKSMKEINAVGHRVVHGGEYFASSVIINDAVKEALEKCCELAPLHNPANLIGIAACEKIMPGVPQVGVFDTAFHQTMPERAYLYAIPYEYYENQEIVGIDAEIVKAIGEKLGYEVVIEDMNFDSIISAVASGKADLAMAGLTVSEERLQSVDFTDSYATSQQVIIVKEDSPITTVDDLFAEGANHTVGVQTATTGDIYTTDDIEAAGLGTVERYTKATDAIAALTAGKIDCVIIDSEPAKSYVAANEGLKILDTEYVTEEYAIALAKDSELTEPVNTALQELIADGTVQSIIDKYITAE